MSQVIVTDMFIDMRQRISCTTGSLKVPTSLGNVLRPCYTPQTTRLERAFCTRPFYSLRRRRRTSKIERRLAGDIFTIIHRLTFGARQVGARRGDVIALGRTFEVDDDLAHLARRRAGDVDV